MTESGLRASTTTKVFLERSGHRNVLLLKKYKRGIMMRKGSEEKNEQRNVELVGQVV